MLESASCSKMFVMVQKNGSFWGKKKTKKEKKKHKPNKIVDTPLHYLWMKQGSLVCFVYHVEISQTTMLHATLLVFSEGVHQLGLRQFGITVWKQLIIKPFSWWKLNKIETENCIEIWECSWCCGKALDKSHLIEFTSQS